MVIRLIAIIKQSKIKSKSKIMKKFTKITVAFLLTLSNVIFASNAIATKNGGDDKLLQAKFVSYADAKLLKAELSDLSGYSKYTANAATEDEKITENTNLDVAFVNYATDDLNDTILELESITNVIRSNKFVSFANAGLLNSETVLLQKSSLTTNEKAVLDAKIIESATVNSKLKLSKKNSRKVLKVKLNTNKY